MASFSRNLAVTLGCFWCHFRYFVELFNSPCHYVLLFSGVATAQSAQESYYYYYYHYYYYYYDDYEDDEDDEDDDDDDDYY